jgi:hypothetical protein
MKSLTVRKAVLPWFVGGLVLGLVQVVAVAVRKPLGVSTQFVVVEGIALHRAAPDFAEDHPILRDEKYQSLGYGWWLDVGLVLGAMVAAVAAGRWRLSARPTWWRANHRGVLSRMVLCFAGGFLILLGARIGHGCTSGQFASGWSQLSLSVIPFTIGMFAAGLLAARIVYPRTPRIRR